MGSGGRAVGPDGKLLPREQKTTGTAPRGIVPGRSSRPQQRGMVRPMRPNFTPGMPPRPLMGGPPMAPGGVLPSFLVQQGPPMMAPFRPEPTVSHGFFGGAQKPVVGPSAPAPVVAKVAPTPLVSQAPPEASAPAPAPPSHVGEVPGFGTNSSIHELFGKMVWKKMEGLRDQAVIDRLQNRIMNLIHDALADQAADGAAPGAPGFRSF